MNTIKNFIFDKSNITASGETREFTIQGDAGSFFNLEIKNEDSHYYNFNTKTFQADQSGLYNQELTSSTFVVDVSFPTVSDPDQYDIFLVAGKNTNHVDFKAVRFEDNSIDLNSSIGSSSKMLKKVLYQLSDVRLTITTITTSNSGGYTSATATTSDNVDVKAGGSTGKTSFTVVNTSAAGKSFSVNKKPSIDDIVCFRQQELGDQSDIPGENTFPTVANTDTVDGAISAGTKIVMDANVADNMLVGDRVTGNTELDNKTVTVVALNPDGDNTKEFSVSEAVNVADGITLSFSPRKNHRFAIDNVVGLKEGNIPTGTNITSKSRIAAYLDSVIINPETTKERKVENFRVKGVEGSGLPTFTNGVKTAQPGFITFNKQQALALANDTVKFYSYGSDALKEMNGYEIALSNIKTTITAVTTTTTSAVSNSVTIPVAEQGGIMTNVSTMSGIGVSASAVDPTVTAKAGTNGAGNLTVSAAQTLESGQTFTFANAGRVLTITGDIEILKAGTSNATIRFDIDRFITAS